MNVRKPIISHRAKLRRNLLLVIFGVLVISGVYLFSAKNDDKNPNTDSTIPVAASTEVPFEWDQVEVTGDNARKALNTASDGLSIKVTDTSVKEVSAANNEIVITLNPFDILSENYYVRQIGESMIAYCRVLFRNDNVERVILNSSILAMDGGTSLGAQMIWDRSTIVSIDYDYDGMLTEAQTNVAAPYRAGESFTLQPVVLDGLSQEIRTAFE